jgi:hypothetical protein
VLRRSHIELTAVRKAWGIAPPRDSQIGAPSLKYTPFPSPQHHRMSTMNERLTPDHFLPHVTKSFRVLGGYHSLTLSKIDMRRLEEWERKLVQVQPFNLIFTGPPGDVLPEGMYKLEVEGGPTFDLYVMPIHTPDRGRQDYQASFN